MESELIDVSEGGARIADVPDLNLRDQCALHLEGAATPIPFVVMDKAERQIQLSLAARGETRQLFLAWLQRRTLGMEAA
jgi:hypothetical protein